MPSRVSAGIVLHRHGASGTEVLLGHMGGPMWSRRDEGAWTIPKGEHGTDDDALAAAEREFVEETGQALPDGPRVPLGSVRQSGGKVVTAWAVAGDLDAGQCVSNTCEIEWPPRSGRRITIPEIDRWRWFSLDEAATKVITAQRDLLTRLADLLAR